MEDKTYYLSDVKGTYHIWGIIFTSRRKGWVLHKKEMKKKDFSSNDESKIAFCFLKSFHKNKVKQLVCTELVSQNVSLFLHCT